MDYKVVFLPKLDIENCFEKEYTTHQEAETALNAIADYTLKLHDLKLMPDYSNIGVVLRRDGDDWIEIDGDGEEI